MLLDVSWILSIAYLLGFVIGSKDVSSALFVLFSSEQLRPRGLAKAYEDYEFRFKVPYYGTLSPIVTDTLCILVD